MLSAADPLRGSEEEDLAMSSKPSGPNTKPSKLANDLPKRVGEEVPQGRDATGDAFKSGVDEMTTTARWRI